MLPATLLIITLLLAVLPQAVPFPVPAPAPAPPVIAPDFGRLPLAFVPNAGQTDPDVQFQARGMGGTIFFTSEEVVLSLPTADQPSASAAPEHHRPVDQRVSRRAAQPAHVVDSRPAPTVVRLQFTGANPSPTVTGGEHLPGVVNYLIGNDPAQWRTNLPTYAGVVYGDLYDGIDLRYDGTEGRLKGTYTVAPGADPAQIRWRYAGAEQVQVDAASGDLVLTLPSQATLTEQAPVAWQTINRTRVPVAAHYSVADDGSIGFTLEHYDTRYPLTIDPTLEYSTFLGGSGGGADYGYGIAVDSAGNAYVTGQTSSADFPMSHPLQGVYGGGSYDAFVTKLNADGSALVYSTYLGGSANDRGHGIALSSTGNVYITGYTYSPDFPTARPLQAAFGGDRDAFVTKFNADGSTLVYSTYLGGSNTNWGNGIAVDRGGNAYVTGYTRSDNFPTVRPLQGTFGGYEDAFVTKLNADGSALVYSTYLGGSNWDYGTDITVNSAGNAYITGYTYSLNFPTAHPLQGDHAGGDEDAFVAKLSLDGSALVYSTYLGGGNDDSSNGIAVDSEDNAYITGYTGSENFPTVRPLETMVGNNSADAFVTKLNADGSTLVYSTYLGGNNYDNGYGIAVDSGGNAYVTGLTRSADFPTAHSLDGTLGGYADAFVAKISDGDSPEPPTPEPPTPEVPTPVPDNDTPSVGNRPAQSRVVGSITVYAESFTGTPDAWQATGTVWLGNYTIVEEADISATGGTLAGSGLVSMITTADGSRRTRFFRDSFDVSGHGVLTPRAVNGDWRLNNMVGFAVTDPPTQVTIDVAQGHFRSTLKLAVVIPGNRLVKEATLTLDHTGAAQGTLRDMALDLGQVTLTVSQAVLGNDGLAITDATLQLPTGLGGAQAALTVGDARITGDGQLHLGSGSAQINFPNIHIGGDTGFGIEGAQATLTIDGETYLFSGAGTFVLPGVGPGTGGCKVGTGFTLASTPPPLREATLSIDGCFKIPIANTGFFLTKVTGTVQLDEGDYVAIDVGIGIEGGPEVPGLGAALSGEPAAHWDTSWKVGLSGTLKVFTFDVADAALTLSRANGLEGTLNISLHGGLVQGSGRFHVWHDQSSFHITGSQQVEVRIDQGQIYQKCALGVCLNIPPATIQGPRVGADFGEFRTNGGTIYGIKGRVNILGYHPAFFVNAQDGSIRFDRNGLHEYQLVDAISLQANTDVRHLTVAPDTEALLVSLAVDSGSPTLSLTTPGGQTLDAGSPEVVATTVATQTLLTVPNPTPGAWQVVVGNLNGGEQYLVVALGAQPPAEVTAPIITDNGDGSYTITMVGSSSTPTSTLSLFYDRSDSERTGIALVEELPLTTSSYTWQPTAMASGTYYLYAMVDDPLGAPAYAYSATPITITDTTPPDTPAGLAGHGCRNRQHRCHDRLAAQ